MQLFSGKQYLKIDIANAFGLDKKDWDERLAWFDQNESKLDSLVKDADDPAQFYSGMLAYQNCHLPSGHMIALDATSSGIQILSALTGDRKAAEVCNVIDTGHRRDAYTDLFVSMKSRVSSNTTIIRDDLKNAIMTAFYGSEAVPKRVFGEGALLMAFFKTLEIETPIVWSLNKNFLKMWNPNVSEYNWKLPDNFHVKMKVWDTVQAQVQFRGHTYTTNQHVNQPTESGRAIGANVTHSVDGMIVREMARRCMYDPRTVIRVQTAIIEGNQPGKSNNHNDEMVKTLWTNYKKSGYLSARILDYLDTTNIHMVDTDPLQDLLDSLPKRPFEIVSVHDCFKCHPNYGNDLRKQYNLQLSLIAKSGLLTYILSQLLGRYMPVNKAANLGDEILNANYALS